MARDIHPRTVCSIQQPYTGTDVRAESPVFSWKSWYVAALDNTWAEYYTGPKGEWS